MKRTTHFGRLKGTLVGAILILSSAAPTAALIPSSPNAKVAGDIVVTKPVDKASTKLF
jgi:hypothetical protein